MDCHICREQNQFFEDLFEKYRDKVKFGFTHFGSYVSNSALASEAAGNQGKFWEMHDSIFALQSIPDSTALFRIARSLNLKMDDFVNDYESIELKDQIQGNLLKLEDAGVYGTPTVFINNKPIFDNSSSEEIESLLEVEMKREY